MIDYSASRRSVPRALFPLKWHVTTLYE